MANTQLAESHVLHRQSQMELEHVTIQTSENFPLLLKVPPFALFLNRLNLIHLTHVLWGERGSISGVNWRFEHGRSSGCKSWAFLCAC